MNRTGETEQKQTQNVTLHPPAHPPGILGNQTLERTWGFQSLELTGISVSGTDSKI